MPRAFPVRCAHENGHSQIGLCTGERVIHLGVSPEPNLAVAVVLRTHRTVSRTLYARHASHAVGRLKDTHVLNCGGRGVRSPADLLVFKRTIEREATSNSIKSSS